MRLFCVVISALALACGSTSGSGSDGGGGGDDGGGSNIDPDGGTGTPHTVKLTLTNRPMNAQTFSFFVAYQDGSAPWAAAPAPSGDTYTLEISAPTWGIAYGCIGNVTGTSTTQLRTVTTAHFAIGERTDLTLDVPTRCSDRGSANVTLSGTVTNRPFTGGVLVVQFGNRSTIVNNQTGGFSISTPPGTHDLIVTSVFPQGNGEYYADETLAIRDVAVTGPTTRTIDFNNADQAQSFQVNVGFPDLQSRVLATTTLYTSNGTTAGLTRESTNPESNALATGQMRTTDVYDQSIAVTRPGSGVTVTNATNMPGTQTYVAPAPLGTVNASVATKQPYSILQATWPAYPNSIGYVWNANQQLTAQQCGGNAGCTIVWASFVSPGVVGTMPGYMMPDLSMVPGWKTAFALANGAQVVGGVTAETSSAGAGDFPPPIPANGTKRTFVRTDFSVMP